MANAPTRLTHWRRRIRRRLRRLAYDASESALRRVIVRYGPRDPDYEAAACAVLMRDRLRLPTVELQDLLDETIPPVTIGHLPRGRWSSPVADMVAIARIVATTRPTRALEVGSFRGFTTMAMAENLSPGGTIVAVDIDPKHGAAYRDTDLASRIDRRVGTAQNSLMDEPPNSFDLIFVDADHRFESVAHDSATLVPLLADDGWLIWHDYANWGHFTQACGVPEFVHEFARDRPVVHIAGTSIAVHRPSWTGQDAEQLASALEAMGDRADDSAWSTEVARS